MGVEARRVIFWSRGVSEVGGGGWGGFTGRESTDSWA